MIESRIDLPEVSAELREQVESADAILREEGSKLKGHTVRAYWKADGSFPTSERISLTLLLGKVHMSFVVWPAQLSDPKKVRAMIRDHMWTVVTTFALNNQEEILKLAEELKPELEVAER